MIIVLHITVNHIMYLSTDKYRVDSTNKMIIESRSIEYSHIEHSFKILIY